jgi:hypothetical protein
MNEEQALNKWGLNEGGTNAEGMWNQCRMDKELTLNEWGTNDEWMRNQCWMNEEL